MEALSKCCDRGPLAPPLPHFGTRDEVRMLIQTTFAFTVCIIAARACI